MDYETQIQLNKLVEGIDGVSGQLERLAENASSPDWWIIILTLINIGAFIFVACTQIKQQKQQIKLQEQQAKAQEY